MPSHPLLRPKGMFPKKKMSEFPVEGTENGDGGGGGKVAAVMETLQKKSSQGHLAQSSSTQQMMANSSSSSTTTTTSRVAKTSQRMHHVTSSEMKASSMKSDLSELKSSISEMRNLSALHRLRSSMEDLVEDGGGGGGGGGTGEPLVTFPDPETPPPPSHPGPTPPPALTSSASAETLKFEQKRMTSASKTKLVTDAFSSEQASANTAEMKRMQAGELSYQENSAQAQLMARLEMDGVSAEKSLNMMQEQRSLKAGDITQQESQNMSAATMRLQTESYSAEKKAMAAQQQRQTVTSTGVFNQEKHVAQSTQSNITYTTKGICTKSSLISSQMSQLMNGQNMNMIEDDVLGQGFEDLESLNIHSSEEDVDRAVSKYKSYVMYVVKNMKKEISTEGSSSDKAVMMLNRMYEMMRKAWAVPTHGHAVGTALCDALRESGGLDLLLTSCSADEELQFSSAQLLEQCLTTENRDYVVEKGLDKVVTTACLCIKNPNSIDHARVGTGILQNLFKHSEGTCSDVIKLGGLDAVLFECRKNDIETLRHCAGALANLSLYGGSENQEAMIKRKVPMWLFPLAFHNDDNIKYYACLAIAVLVANKEIEAAVLKSGTLDLVEPFITSHNPSDFAKSNLAHAHGQSKHWLERLVPVLTSKREEACNLAAFHFCMEAGIKKQQNCPMVFRDIGAIEPLKNVASSPNAIASKFAVSALKLIGEEVPHKLSQQVPLWSTEDVREWVRQIGFGEYTRNFTESKVDGDLLLQLTEENLCKDIGIVNGIRRKRFTRELQNLKKMADYSSRDVTNLNTFLQDIGPEYPIYTYAMLNAGVARDNLLLLTEDQLKECGISNSIHRLRIMDEIQKTKDTFNGLEQNKDSLEVFVSYRRSNGSQLASLLKVHLHLKGFKVFIDVERLEAGKFDNNLLKSIRNAKHFLLVLTPNALDRCVGDTDCKDWVHREIVAALDAQCNIIPIIDNFQWPEPEELPEDMRAVCHFNGVRWIHDYQDACVEKLERFMKGENDRGDGRVGRTMGGGRGDVTPGTPSHPRHPPNYQALSSSLNGEGFDARKD